MNGSAIRLVVSGPVPGSAHADAESATALARELHTRTILHVARAGVEDPNDAVPGYPDELIDGGGRGGRAPLGRKGVDIGALAELVVTGLFSATTVAALAQVAVAFVQRGAARRITLRDGGRTLTISAPSEETEQLVAEWLGMPPRQSGVRSGAD